MTSQTLRRRLLGTIAAVSVAISLTACGSTMSGQLGADQQIATTCPKGKLLDTVIGVDGTSSFRSSASKAANLEIIDGRVRRTAICGGHVHVFGFASSTGETQAIYDGTFTASAPTENAKLRMADKLATPAMRQITSTYDTALNKLTGNGTDVLGMLNLLEQAMAQAPTDSLDAVLLTDGLTNTGVDPTTAATTTTARSLADSIAVPNLSGASVTIAGIGKEAQGEIPSSVIQNVTVFWQRICTRSHASKCIVVTDAQ